MLFGFVGITTISNAQFLDKLSNPLVTVDIVHPPGFGFKNK